MKLLVEVTISQWLLRCRNSTAFREPLQEVYRELRTTAPSLCGRVEDNSVQTLGCRSQSDSQVSNRKAEPKAARDTVS